MTQEDLANRAGVSRKWISEAESGKTGLRLSTVLQLLDALDVDLVLSPRNAGPVDLDELLGLGELDE
jgi:HTH-type transcriptional regulator/antitoxin HipB